MDKKKECFVIMPFGEEGTIEHERNLKIYQWMIKPVVEECGYKSIRADELEHFGNITRDIIELLYESDLVVADLSGKNANVFYELGVRHSLFKAGTVPIIQKGEKLPFDISNYRALIYNSELDGPEKFKKELKKRIQAFENANRNKSDNPVHEILGEKLVPIDATNYVTKSEHEKKLTLITRLNEKIAQSKTQSEQIVGELKNKYKADLQKSVQKNEQIVQKNKELERQIKELKEQNKTSTSVSQKSYTKLPLLRKTAKELSDGDAKKMLKTKGFCDNSWNKNGKTYKNSYDTRDINGDKIVSDKTSGLMWQQSGSLNYRNYKKAKEYVAKLNKQNHAGFNDWRLPTLEEGMSLMEPDNKNNDLYIDSVFDKVQSYIWTSDPYTGSSDGVWVVYFSYGSCSDYGVYGSFFVRAVRSG
jgi:hypothetical protein